MFDQYETVSDSLKLILSEISKTSTLKITSGGLNDSEPNT